jgi:hypothetical protein
MLRRLLASRRRKNQQQIAGRTAEVVRHVLFEVGPDRFVNGTILLDRRFRVRFFSGTPSGGPDIIGAVVLGELHEARVLRRLLFDSAAARVPLEVHIDCVVGGLMRELNAQSDRLRALP